MYVTVAPDGIHQRAVAQSAQQQEEYCRAASRPQGGPLPASRRVRRIQLAPDSAGCPGRPSAGLAQPMTSPAPAIWAASPRASSAWPATRSRCRWLSTSTASLRSSGTASRSSIRRSRKARWKVQLQGSVDDLASPRGGTRYRGLGSGRRSETGVRPSPGVARRCLLSRAREPAEQSLPIQARRQTGGARPRRRVSRRRDSESGRVVDDRVDARQTAPARHRCIRARRTLPRVGGLGRFQERSRSTARLKVSRSANWRNSMAATRAN